MLAMYKLFVGAALTPGVLWDFAGGAGGATGFDVPPFVCGRQGPVNAPSMRATRSLGT